jgi:arginase family enzyme
VLAVSSNASKSTALKARQLIDGASFGPEALKAIGAAFDAAWAEISGNFGHDAADIEKARLRLAKAMLSVANEESRDVDALKRGALQRMALDYRHRR